MTAVHKEEERKGMADVGSIATAAVKAAEMLAKAAEKAALFPHSRRKQYAELIDRAFALLLEEIEGVRRALNEINIECEEGKKDRIIEHLKRLGNSGEWERMERDMRMCAQLRLLHSQMHGFFGEQGDKIAGINRKKLLTLVNQMIQATEGRMADYITENFSQVSRQKPLLLNKTS